MAPTLPVVRALAIAGDRIAGGVGTHETALATPRPSRPGWPLRPAGAERLARPLPDLGARTAPDPAGGNSVARRGACSVCAAATREVKPGGWLRGMGWRGGDWSPPIEPTKEALDRVTGDTPTALMARDYHSLWLNSAALAHANGDLEVEGGVVVRDERGRADRCAARGVRLALPRHLRAADRGRDGRRFTRGRPHRDRPRRHRGARQGRLARSARRVAASFATKARSSCASGSPSRQSRWRSSPICAFAAASATTSFASAT